ncbi:MAG: FAD-binding oxidoreductase [Desulfomicrobium sp.]
MLKIMMLAVYSLSPLIPAILFFSAPTGALTKGLNAVAVTFGMVAYVCFCWQFIFVSRVKFVERVVGQDRLIRFHLYVALGALACAGLHSSLIPGLKGNGLQASIGQLALNIFIYISIFSAIFLSDFFVTKIPHAKKWRDLLVARIRLDRKWSLYAHRVLALALALACLHIMLAPVQGRALFKGSIFIYWAVAMSVYGYRAFPRKRRLGRRPYRVTEVRPESKDAWTVSLEPASGQAPISFAPGQFIYFTPLTGKLQREEHPFSISSSPRENISVTVKSLGDFTSKIGGLERGDYVRVDGPYGRFSYRLVRRGAELVFIAGGIGVTPFLSMLQDLSREAPDRKVILLWGAKHEKDLIRVKEIEALADRLPNLSFYPVLSRETSYSGLRGRIDKNLLVRILGPQPAGGAGDAQREFFICAPPVVIDSVARFLQQLGVAKRKIHFEKFSF